MSVFKTIVCTLRRTCQACHVLPCMLQVIPKQGITPLFNHLNSSTSWFPALGKVTLPNTFECRVAHDQLQWHAHSRCVS